MHQGMHLLQGCCCCAAVAVTVSAGLASTLSASRQPQRLGLLRGALVGGQRQRAVIGVARLYVAAPRRVICSSKAQRLSDDWPFAQLLADLL